MYATCSVLAGEHFFSQELVKTKIKLKEGLTFARRAQTQLQMIANAAPLLALAGYSLQVLGLLFVALTPSGQRTQLLLF